MSSDAIFELSKAVQEENDDPAGDHLERPIAEREEQRAAAIERMRSSWRVGDRPREDQEGEERRRVGRRELGRTSRALASEVAAFERLLVELPAA